MTLAERNSLVETHLPLVRPIARRVKKHLPPSFELQDLIAEGNMGLLNAATRYNPADHDGTPFAAFARPHIHGAIVDSARRRAWLDNTAYPLDDAPEQAHQRILPFLLRSKELAMHRRPGPGRAESPFPRKRIPRALYLALRRLTSRQRAILGAVYNDGASFAQMGQLLHCAPREAQQEHARAIAILHAALLPNVSIMPSTLVFLSERAA